MARMKRKVGEDDKQESFFKKILVNSGLQILPRSFRSHRSMMKKKNNTKVSSTFVDIH